MGVLDHDQPAVGRRNSLLHTRKTACVIALTSYALDARVRRETEMLLSDGWALDVVCLRDAADPPVEWSGKVRLLHVPGRRYHGHSVLTYFLEHLTFFVSALFCVTWLTLSRRYSLIHVHNLPDFLVFAAVVPRLLGARVLLDIRDPVPDLYQSKFGAGRSHLAVQLARWFEKVSTTFVDHVLVPGEPSRQRLLGRNVPPEKLTNILNSADPRLFQALSRAVDTARFTLVYHGGLYKRYGVDNAIRAVHQLRRDIPGLRLRIAGTGEEAEDLRRLVEDLDLSEYVTISEWLPLEQTVRFVGQADLGIVPYRRDTFTDLIYPTKAFECIVMGIPVVMSELAGIVELFPDVPDLFFPPDDVDAIAQHILRLFREPERLRRLNENLQRAYAPYGLEVQREKYLKLVERLLSNRGNKSERGASVH